MSEGQLSAINVSGGGVPKLAIDECEVTRAGLVGDAHAKPGIHGGPTRAVSLYSKEHIDALAREGHPIAPGTIGENLTIAGLDWESLDPGVRLRIGRDVLIEITSYAAPCRTIAHNFSDRRQRRVDQGLRPGWSRLYAEVTTPGVIRRGDPVVVAEHARQAVDRDSPNSNADYLVSTSLVSTSDSIEGASMKIGYVNLYVTNLKRSMDFFCETLGLQLQYGDEDFGYASVDSGPIRMGLAQVDVEDPHQRALVGRQTGIGFAVKDLAQVHKELEAKGVIFTMPPSKQPWGTVMAMFEDPDKNVFYLDEAAEEAAD